MQSPYELPRIVNYFFQHQETLMPSASLWVYRQALHMDVKAPKPDWVMWPE
jgi:hypothetical protein